MNLIAILWRIVDMSIQFRARTIDNTISSNPLTPTGPSHKGWCCNSGTGSVKSKPQCDNDGGYFLPGISSNRQCPSCPAAAAFTSSSGSCCYSVKTNGIYTPYCQNVTSDSECAILHQGGAEGLKYKFFVNTTCQTSEGGDSGCGDVSSNLGNCCTQNPNGTVSCSIVSKEKCFGFWSPQVNSIMSCVDLTPCSGAYFSGITADKCSATASLAQLQSTINPIEKLPTGNVLYQGGLYVGIFTPGSPRNTTGVNVYGSPATGDALTYKARGTGLGTSKNKWIIIAATTDYYYLPTNSDNVPPSSMNTSVYDGVYNSYGADSNKASVYLNLNRYYHNGFNDWYVPSQDELAFYFKTIGYNFSLPNDYTNLKEKNYLTSTAFTTNNEQNFDNNYFMYSQSAVEEKYGNVSIVSRKSPQNIRLFRRIYLND